MSLSDIFLRFKRALLCALFLFMSPLIGENLTLKEKQCAVTYALSGGRFGDNLLAFCHAAWFSHAYNIPLVYKSFPFADSLVLSSDNNILHSLENGFSSQFSLRDTFAYLRFYNMLTTATFPEKTLITVPYFPENHDEYLKIGHVLPPFVEIDWDDSSFLEKIRTWIAPKQSISTVKPSGKKFSVAIHMRMGGQGDYTNVRKFFPFKFPNIEFYQEALSTIAEIAGAPLEVYLFTDSTDPESLIKKLKNKQYNVSVDFFPAQKQPGVLNDVLEDFFSFAGFDALIRPDSNFSFIAGKLFDFKMVLSPQEIKVANKKITTQAIKLELLKMEGIPVQKIHLRI